MTARAYLMRFTPSDERTMTPARKMEIQRTIDQLAQLLSEAIATNEKLWDENDRLQEAIDRNLALVAEHRGMLGRAERRARTAERILDDMSPDCITHAEWCDANSDEPCTCRLVELRERVRSFQARPR